MKFFGTLGSKELPYNFKTLPDNDIPGMSIISTNQINIYIYIYEVDLSSTEPNWMELYIPYKTSINC